MNSVRPYLFWIVTGSILLIVLIAAMILDPRYKKKRFTRCYAAA